MGGDAQYTKQCTEDKYIFFPIYSSSPPLKINNLIYLPIKLK